MHRSTYKNDISLVSVSAYDLIPRLDFGSIGNLERLLPWKTWRCAVSLASSCITLTNLLFCFSPAKCAFPSLACNLASGEVTVGHATGYHLASCFQQKLGCCCWMAPAHGSMVFTQHHCFRVASALGVARGVVGLDLFAG